MEPSPALNAFLEAWRESFTTLLSQLTSEAWQSLRENESEAYEPAFAFRVTTERAPGAVLLHVRRPDLASLLGIFLGEEIGLSAELDETQREGSEELLRQWCGLAAGALEKDYGELSFKVAWEDENGRAADAGLAKVMGARSASRSIAVAVELDHAMIRWLHDFDDRSAAPSPPTASSGSSCKAPSRVEELLQQGNLELLMEVELPVMLRFGARQVTLLEVLELAAGAVLELDREIREPVDLVLNGKVIARGEVVVIDGNYGLRVSEVASPQQRANSL